MSSPSGSNSSENLRRVVVDFGLAGGLACILAAIIVGDLAMSAISPPSKSEKDKRVQELVEQKREHVETTEVPETKPLRLAVTAPIFDDMGRLLNQLGDGYKFTTIAVDQLRDKNLFSQYDVIFLTCGDSPESWLGARVDGGPSSRNATTYTMKQDVKRELQDNLRNFVNEGGTLYASDWRFTLIGWAFPELVDNAAAVNRGTEQSFQAQVVDDGLRELIGERIHLTFDLGGWFPAAFKGRTVKKYLEGKYQIEGGGETTSPLLIKFPSGKGTVLFTSFHNEKQNSEQELALLKYLVFTTITARAEAKVTETMVKGGFSPQKQSLLSTSKESPTVTKTYDCKKVGHLQFVLAFENQGALLQLDIEGPGGRKLTKEGVSTITLDVADAPIGPWKYTVTAKKVPYENFPFTLTVWEK